MKILAFDLSTTQGSLVWRDEDCEIEEIWPNDRQNSARFFEYVAKVRKNFGLPETIIVGVGPGSYAGTRIAISTAIGLQTASDAILLGYPSICALAAGDYCVIGDARRDSFFFAQISDSKLSEGPGLFTTGELRARLAAERMPIFASEASLSGFQNVQVRFPSAKILAQLALRRDLDFVRSPVEPIYLREPHITQPKMPK